VILSDPRHSVADPRITPAYTHRRTVPTGVGVTGVCVMLRTRRVLLLPASLAGRAAWEVAMPGTRYAELLPADMDSKRLMADGHQRRGRISGVKQLVMVMC
jgi:hypothetical protein